MSGVVVVDHHDSYTHNLVHLVASVTGATPVVVQHDEVTLSCLTGFGHVVLSPGPGHPGDVADFALGPQVFALGVPVLGVCLGMQALVVAFGGTVEVDEPAHGEVASIRHDGRGVFAGLPQDFAAVRYHSLHARDLPEDLEASAWCDGPAGRTTLMGARHRSLPLEGVQFHPESILTEHGAAMVASFLASR